MERDYSQEHCEAELLLKEMRHYTAQVVEYVTSIVGALTVNDTDHDGIFEVKKC